MENEFRFWFLHLVGLGNSGFVEIGRRYLAIARTSCVILANWVDIMIDWADNRARAGDCADIFEERTDIIGGFLRLRGDNAELRGEGI
ncbi:hypothetical protein [Sporosarcina sp. 6E9]|uniref:hypothetical protein n=1 Tax=Sporosarcina sp. 6E9 TaxID=2819235 RepID=UPI001B314606|nr:hypothetical protein [Sporosarcina sp. 6E9]